MKVIVVIMGVSGVVYGVKLVEVLKEFGYEVVVFVLRIGIVVIYYEFGIKLKFDYDEKDLFVLVVLGFYFFDVMVVVFCLMKMFLVIVNGYVDNLIMRVVDVVFKEK